MRWTELARGIGLSRPAFLAASVELENYAELRELFFADTAALIEKIGGAPGSSANFLRLYMRLGAESYDGYKKRGISDEIYFDTFCDYTVWSGVCRRETGVWGLNQPVWLSLPIKLEVFKIGRLQYAQCALDRDIIIDGKPLKKGLRVYAVHIRADEPFDPDVCDASFAAAKKFFGEDVFVCTCDSWLLSPVLRGLLSAGSNIIRFQNRFTVVSVNATDRSAERYILKNTSLFECLSGRTIGSAFGAVCY